MSTSAPSENAGENMQPRIQIVGAGIAGLSLACHLRLKKIPFKIFDGASKPKGHNYGITILPTAYKSLLPALEVKPDLSSFIKLTAADRLIGGHGVVSASDRSTTKSTAEQRIRVADAALRDVLAQGHNIKWNHKVTETNPTPNGLTLKFEDGSSSTAPITIDAGGERSGLLSSLLPDLKPTVLPSAVYHGSRYISLPDFESKYKDLFPSSSNVAEHIYPFQPPYPSSPKLALYIQLSKSHIKHSTLPSPLRSKFQDQKDETLVELRYTISRPALSQPDFNNQNDPIFNPDRSTSEAKTVPEPLFEEISNLLSQNKDKIPQALRDLISPSEIKANKDRVLNWLLRVKVLSSDELNPLAEDKGVIIIGDSAHRLPILGSKGASHAMEDARILADFLAEKIQQDNANNDEELRKGLARFYEEKIEGAWIGAEMEGRHWLSETEDLPEAESKL